MNGPFGRLERAAHLRLGHALCRHSRLAVGSALNLPRPSVFGKLESKLFQSVIVVLTISYDQGPRSIYGKRSIRAPWEVT